MSSLLNAVSPRKSSPGTRRRHLWIILILLAGVALAAALHVAWRRRRPVSPVVVVPERLEQLQPALAALIQKHLETVRKAPQDPVAHATLGLVYEANSLWSEARSCYETAYELQPDEPMWIHHAAAVAMSAGDFDGALQLLRDAAVRFPDFAPLQYRFGDALLSIGTPAEAEAAFQRTIKSAPSQCEGYVGLGEAKLRAGSYAEAAAILEQAVKMDPSYRAARYLLGMAYRALGRGEEARRQLALGTGGKKRYLLDAWQAKTAEFEVGVLSRLNRSSRLMHAGRIADAVRLMEKTLASYSDDVRVMDKLGEAYLRAGRIEEALEVLQRAVRLDERHLGININLASCYLSMNRLDDAIRAADRAVALVPDVWNAHFIRGAALRKLGKYEAAYESLLAAVRLKPTSPTVYNTIAEVAVALERYAEAKEHYRAALERWPWFVPAYLGLADVCIRLELWDEAAAALKTAGDIVPNSTKVAELEDRLAARKSR